MEGWEDLDLVVEPGVLGRCSWEVDEARRDLEVLAWIGRFRFVTAQAIGERFGVSWQRANARVRRLERAGLVGYGREHVSQARAVFLTGRGHELLGWPRRRAPRAQVQREHEAAIVWLVTELERDAGVGVRVLTERECRRREAGGVDRYSVEVVDGSRLRRWPDVVVERGEERRAVEIEFAPKGSSRLAAIVAGYECSSFAEALFFVRRPALGRRLAQVVAEQQVSIGPVRRARRVVRVLPWPGLAAGERARVAAAIAREGAGARVGEGAAR
jgi:DNA-binding MarR family transcriptional regulator